MNESRFFPAVCLHSVTSPLPFSDAVPDTIDESQIFLCCGNVNQIFQAEISPVELLSAQQRSEAEKIKNADRKWHFIIIRACLNLFLSRFTGTEPAKHVFLKNESGKPFLKSPEPKLHFNLSHAGDDFLIAVSIHPVGVDLEKKDRKIPELDDIIKRYYSHEEQQAVNTSTYPEETFLRIWTIKEAVIKAIGTGIHENLKALNTLSTDDYSEMQKDVLHVFTGSLNDFFFSIATPDEDAEIRAFPAGQLF